MKTKPNAIGEKRELTLPEIRALMEIGLPTPIEITPRLPQESLEEDKEVYGYLTDSERVKYSQETGHAP